VGSFLSLVVFSVVVALKSNRQVVFMFVGHNPTLMVAQKSVAGEVDTTWTPEVEVKVELFFCSVVVVVFVTYQPVDDTFSDPLVFLVTPQSSRDVAG
jgi:hypothetical protein